MDLRTVAENPEVYTSHLRSRQAPEELLAGVASLSGHYNDRNVAIAGGDKERAQQNALAASIGKHLKAGDTAAADTAKEEVAGLSPHSSAKVGSSNYPLTSMEAPFRSTILADTLNFL